MQSRRNFLELTAKLAAAGCVLGRTSMIPAQAQPGEGMIYGVQMYMVRRQAATDLAGAFRSIHDAGFNQVELYPIAYTHPPAELRRMIADAGLGAVSGHFDYTGRAMSVDYAHALGLKYLVCPMLPQAQWTSLAGFHQASTYFNQWGESARQAGLEFVFHNHDYEFRPMEGSNGFTVLMRETDPALVKLEFDLYWLTQAGQDPAAMLRQHRDRAVLVHLKDRTPGAPTSFDMSSSSAHFTELGKGTIAWPALLRQARAQGIRYAFLDQDDTAGPVEASMRQSHTYLETLHI